MNALWYLRMLRYGGIFMKELALANYQVAKLVLQREIKIRPGFVAVPVKTESEFETTVLANSITLTPGTITVHVEMDKKLMVIHAIDIGDSIDGVRASVQNALEKPILEWTRTGQAAAEGGTP